MRRMIQSIEVFPDEQIVVPLIRELSRTHFLALLPLKQPLQREFDAEMCRPRWLPDAETASLADRDAGML